MENNKYYIPTLSDLFVGYECEKENINMGEYDNGKNNIYSPLVVTGELIKEIDDFIRNGGDIRYSKGLPIDNLRTPYLTKQQIKDEGWEEKRFEGSDYLNKIQKYRTAFQKDNYMLIFDAKKPHIEIAAKDVTLVDFLPCFPEWFRVTTPCPSINEFRRITKLLGV